MVVVGTYRLGVVWALLAMSEELLELDCCYYYQVKTHLHRETVATWGEVWGMASGPDWVLGMPLAWVMWMEEAVVVVVAAAAAVYCSFVLFHSVVDILPHCSKVYCLHCQDSPNFGLAVVVAVDN